MSETLDEFRQSFREQAIQEGAMAPEVREVARDESGRFAARTPEPDQPVEEPVAEVDEVEPVEEPEPEVLFAGKYKSAEELERAHLELQRKLGETSQERAELRRLEQEIEQLRAQVQPAQPQYDTEQLEDWFDENPNLVPAAAQDALARQDWALYHAAMERWFEMQPRAASAFERQVELQQLRYEMESKLAESTRPLADQTQAQMFNVALANLQQEFPEITNEKFAEQMMEEARNLPALLGVLRDGDVAAKQQTMRSLALMARGRMSDTLVTAAKKEAQREQQTAADAKREASVLTSSSGGPAAAPAVDAFREAFRNSPEFRKAAGLI